MKLSNDAIKLLAALRTKKPDSRGEIPLSGITAEVFGNDAIAMTDCIAALQELNAKGAIIYRNSSNCPGIKVPTATILRKDVRPVLREGDLAYYDTFAGMVPCRVLKISGTSGAAGTSQNVIVKMTATRGGYRRGHIVSTFGHHVVPRDAYFQRRHGARIGYYTIEVPNSQTEVAA